MLATTLAVAATLLQPPSAPAPARQAAPAPDAPAALAQRLAAVREKWTFAPVLVLVPDEPSFIAALAHWAPVEGKPRALFPILIDDGSFTARQDIARFARAFKPTSTVRFAAKGDAPTAATLAAALATSWGAADEPAYNAALAGRAESPGPLGAVVTDPTDPARCAAAALASAYGQALIFVPSPAPAINALSMAATDKLTSAIAQQLTARKLAWNRLGDQIDAVTLCLNTPANVTVGKSDAPQSMVDVLVAKPGESLALTDLIGRSTEGFRADRWAFTSQLFGSPARSTYAAMASIFLRPTAAVAFNSYDRTGEFGAFNPTDGLKALHEAGLAIAALDKPTNGAEDWRAWASGSFTPDARWPRAAGPQPKGGALTADLFMVNTMGNEDFFQLASGLCYAGDVPFLEVPAAVNFTHSWSLRMAHNPLTVGGRWLDRGAFCYVGSVHEPYLSAFTPQSLFAGRLTKGWPIAAAARVLPTDKFTMPGGGNGPPFHPFSSPWRISILGDALWTLGHAAPRTGAPPALPGSTDPAARLAEEAKAGRFDQVIDTLCILGRDADAARWSKALAAERDKLNADAAARAVMAAYRAGDLPTIIRAARRLDPAKPEPAVTDAIWHAVYPNYANMTAQEARLLAEHVRPYSYAWDTTTAAAGLRNCEGIDAARTFFNDQVKKAPSDFARKRLEEARSTVFR